MRDKIAGFVVLGLTLCVAVGTIGIVRLQRQTQRDPGQITDNAVQTTTYNDTVMHVQSFSYAKFTEDELIERASYVGRGRIEAVSTSCWNNSDCMYWQPSAEFEGPDEEPTFIPLQYYTATIIIEDEWYDTIGVTTPVTVTEFGASPYDAFPNPMGVMATAAANATPAHDSVVAWTGNYGVFHVGDEVVVMLRREPMTFRGGAQDMTVVSGYGGVYSVGPEGVLDNPIVDPHSPTLSALHERVEVIKGMP